MATVIIKKFKPVSTSEDVRIVPIGDVHIGAAACDEGHFKATVRYIQENELHWIGMGDYCDFINMKDPRFSVGSLADWIGRPELLDLAKAQRERFLEIIAPIASRCLGLVAGNHETAILRHYERDVYSEIVTGVKERGGFAADERLAVGYYGWLRLKFGRHGSKKDRREIMVNVHHGFVGGKLAGAKALNMQRWLWSHNCDLAIFGHSHNTGSQREGVECVDRANNIYIHDRIGCYSGTFLKSVQEDVTTYSEFKGYFPLPTGGSEVYLRPYAKYKKVRVMT